MYFRKKQQYSCLVYQNRLDVVKISKTKAKGFLGDPFLHLSIVDNIPTSKNKLLKLGIYVQNILNVAGYDTYISLDYVM